MSISDNDRLLHRREFFKKTAKTVFPLVAVMSLPSTLMSCGNSSNNEDWDDNDGDNSEDDGVHGTLGVTSADGLVNGYGYVDLGLSVKWAIHNYGTKSPSGYGTRCKGIYGNGSPVDAGFWKSCSLSGTQFDRATKEWGSKWRMPTKAQFLELINNTISSLYTYKGVEGILFVSKKNKKSLFLPFAGVRNYYGGKWENWGQGNEAEYWAGDALLGASVSDMAYLHAWKKKSDVKMSMLTGDMYSYERSLRPVTDSVGQITGCGNNCANNSTNSSCSNCSSSCSSGCKTSCDYNCAATCKSHCYGQCSDTCGGGCKAASKGSSCSGCARTCNNRCYQTCSYACSSNCESSCVKGTR